MFFSIAVLCIKKILGVSIVGSTNKLFICNDSNSALTKELIFKLSQYNHIDSTNVNGIVTLTEYIIDDSKEGVDYYFYKDNLTNYKKIRTSVAMGWYDCPTLKCK
ncbi:MAG: hypothetical protein WBG43_12975 [Marinifilaceae bacterium]